MKNIIKLQKYKKERKNKNLFIVEGYLEIKMALKGNFKLKKVFICKKIFNKKKKDFSIFKKFIFFINKKNYSKISYRKNSEGIIGIFKNKKINYEKKINKLIKKKNIFIILDNLEKPGNIGSIIRTVETTKIIDFIIFNNFKDIYNPNIIRSSLGTIFIFPIFILSFQKILKIINKNSIFLLGTSIQKKKNISLYNIKFNYNKLAIIFGNEHYGINKIWYKYIKYNINIPMFGFINSLNVSVSVAIILFEILRQKIYSI